MKTTKVRNGVLCIIPIGLLLIGYIAYFFAHKLNFNQISLYVVDLIEIKECVISELKQCSAGCFHSLTSFYC